MNEISQFLENLVNDPQDSVDYQPSMAYMLGSVAAAILLQRIIHWYVVAYEKPFYKFHRPCDHKDYEYGESWTEELAFSRHELEDALALTSYKITKGKSRKNAPNALAYFWTDINRKTWYEVNGVALMRVVNSPEEIRNYNARIPKRARYGHVYLIQSSTGHYKIGETRNVSNRIEMFAVKLPFEIEILHTIECEDRRAAERKLHDRFADKRVNGEWFALTLDDVAWIKSIVTDGAL